MTLPVGTMPANLSFGVEVEFLIAALHPGMEDPHKGIEGLPPALRITETQLRGMTRDIEAAVYKRVKDVIDDCFRGRPTTSFITAAEAGLGGNNPRESRYRFWGVEKEVTVSESTANYRYYSVEIKSPAEYATEEAFEAVYLAVAAVTSKFRCLVNQTCGLHVHVGLGRERLSLEQIRRVASLSYAVEPLLFTLHDPRRAVSSTDFRPPVAHESGTLYTACYRYIGETVRHGESPMSTREGDEEQVHVQDFLQTRKPGHFEPFHDGHASKHTHTFSRGVAEEVELRIAKAEISQLATTGGASSIRSDAIPEAAAEEMATTLRQIPRVKVPVFDEAFVLGVDKTFGHNGFSIAPELASEVINKRLRAVDAFEATAEIYAQPASCGVAELLLSQRQRLATSFDGYTCHALQDSRAMMRTVEVRFGSGSLDAEWIAAWAKICVGVFRPSRGKETRTMSSISYRILGSLSRPRLQSRGW